MTNVGYGYRPVSPGEKVENVEHQASNGHWSHCNPTNRDACHRPKRTPILPPPPDDNAKEGYRIAGLNDVLLNLCKQFVHSEWSDFINHKRTVKEWLEILPDIQAIAVPIVKESGKEGDEKCCTQEDVIANAAIAATMQPKVSSSGPEVTNGPSTIQLCLKKAKRVYSGQKMALECIEYIETLLQLEPPTPHWQRISETCDMPSGDDVEFYVGNSSGVEKVRRHVNSVPTYFITVGFTHFYIPEAPYLIPPPPTEPKKDAFEE